MPQALAHVEGDSVCVLNSEGVRALEDEMTLLLDPVALGSPENEGLTEALSVGKPSLAEAQGEAVAVGVGERLREGERLPLGLPEGDRVPTTVLVSLALALEKAEVERAAEGESHEAVALGESWETVGAGVSEGNRDRV